MPTNVILPKQGLQMTEGLITRWLFAEGDSVAEGQPLFEMETDKTTVAVDAPASGVLLKIVRGEFETVPVAEVVAVIGEPGEGAGSAPAPRQEPPKRDARRQEPPKEEPAKKARKAGDARVFATPRAKTAAREAGLDCKAVAGSGPDGLVIERDVLAQKPAPEAGEIAVDPSPMRRAIWEAMMASTHGMAQARHRMHVDMTQAAGLRGALKASGRAVSFNDILMLALCRALREHPALNSLTVDGRILRKSAVHMGLAVALDDGLVVPTIFNAHEMSLLELHEAASSLVDRARRGALRPEEYAGGTFTLTNLGMYGIDEFDAIINPPQAAILAVGKIADTPVVADGRVVVRAMARLTLTYDHRVVDGAPAAAFLARVAELLQNPAVMFCL